MIFQRCFDKYVLFINGDIMFLIWNLFAMLGIISFLFWLMKFMPRSSK